MDYIELNNNKNQSKKVKAIGYAILAALLYGISAPVSKLLLVEIPPTLMAALLYLGAGVGMLAINTLKLIFKKEEKDIPDFMKDNLSSFD